MLTKRTKTSAIKDVRIHETDTGSPEVQIAVLSKKIDQLSKHLKGHHTDNHSRRGLLKMVADRHSLVRYLKRKDLKRYNSLAKKVGLKSV